MTVERPVWRSFWGRGGFWLATVLVLAYLAIYLLLGKLTGLIFASRLQGADVLGSASVVFLGLVLPILLGMLVLYAFAASVGQARSLFARQPIGGRWWMWILPAVVLVINVLRFAAADYSRFTAATVLMVLLLGSCVGVAEETLVRGFVVNLLRRGGHGELAVAMLSSAFFALAHSVNALSGVSLQTVALTVVYTFAFGVAMYFTLRVTRNLVWPIVLHATTDPSGLLLAGGLDTTPDASHQSGLTLIAAFGNLPVILLGFILVWFVRGRVGADEVGPPPTVANAAH